MSDLKTDTARLTMRTLADCRGSVAIVGAFVLTALIMGSGMAVDYAMMVRYRAELQVAADAAAIAGAKEIPLANANVEVIRQAAQSFAGANLDIGVKSATSDLQKSSSMDLMMSMDAMTDGTGTGGSSGGGGGGGSGGSISIDVAVLDDMTAVQVSIEKSWTPFFANFFPFDYSKISVVSKAQVLSSGKICVLGLMESSLWAGIHLDNSSRLDASSCGVYSNSTSFASIRADAGSEMIAESICAAGGYWAQSGSSFEPSPTTDCPPIPDPLESRVAPAIGSCTAIDLVIDDDDDDDDTTLKPGTYCGGLTITGDSEVTLMEGEYIIKDGPLVVADEASLSGENVGFYLSGEGSIFRFMPKTTISLSAPKTGPMAGLLFSEDRNVKGLRIHMIRSNDARQLLGTIYLPKSILQVDANAPVADQSAYTAIVVMRLWLKEGPTLVLNSDYSATDVPVPAALSGGRIVLTQ